MEANLLHLYGTGSHAPSDDACAWRSDRQLPTRTPCEMTPLILAIPEASSGGSHASRMAHRRGSPGNQLVIFTAIGPPNRGRSQGAGLAVRPQRLKTDLRYAKRCRVSIPPSSDT